MQLLILAHPWYSRRCSCMVKGATSHMQIQMQNTITRVVNALWYSLSSLACSWNICSVHGQPETKAICRSKFKLPCTAALGIGSVILSVSTLQPDLDLTTRCRSIRRLSLRHLQTVQYPSLPPQLPQCHLSGRENEDILV